MRKPRRPIHAVVRWMAGLSKTLPNLPILPRKDVRVKRMKKKIVNANEMAMNTGVVAVGALKRSGALLGSTVRSKLLNLSLY